MTMSSSERTYAGQSTSERAEARRRALIEATLDVAVEGGWRQVTVDRVTERAGLSKRYFYESFSGVDEAAEAVVGRVASDLMGAIVIARSQPLEIPELAHATIDALVRHLTEDPRRVRVLFGDLAMSEASAEHRANAIKLIATDVVTIAREIHRAPKIEDPIIEAAAALLIGGTGQAILSWLAGDLPGDRDDLVESLAALWVITGNGAAATVEQRARER